MTKIGLPIPFIVNLYVFQCTFLNILSPILVMVSCTFFLDVIPLSSRLKLFFEQFQIASCVLNSELPVNSRFVVYSLLPDHAVDHHNLMLHLLVVLLRSCFAILCAIYPMRSHPCTDIVLFWWLKWFPTNNAINAISSGQTNSGIIHHCQQRNNLTKAFCQL